jgi:hypothetical protein
MGNGGILRYLLRLISEQQASAFNSLTDLTCKVFACMSSQRPNKKSSQIRKTDHEHPSLRLDFPSRDPYPVVV